MYWITTETATQNHEFTDGDQSQSIPETDLNALWFNTIQRELLNVLAALNITPNVSNFAQIWDALKMIGVRAVYSSDSTVSTSEFDGSLVIFHSVADFQINSLKTKSLLVVVPTWTAASANYITFRYGEQNIRLYKGFVYVGIVANGTIDNLSVFGIRLPMAIDNKNLYVGNLNADKVVSDKRFEKALTVFEYSDEIDESGVEKWRSWELASNWEVGQVKRVYCSNAGTGQMVYVHFDAESNPRQVKFKENCYLEFLCIGTRSCVNDGVTTTYAILLVNGGN